MNISHLETIQVSKSHSLGPERCGFVPYPRMWSRCGLDTCGEAKEGTSHTSMASYSCFYPRGCTRCSQQLLKGTRITIFISRMETSLVAQMIKHLPTMQETPVQSLDWEDLLEKEMTTHASILAWKIPWTEEPGRLQSMGSQRVRHN